MLELRTDIYAIKVTQPLVVVIVCDNYKQVFECKTKITEKYVKDCIGKAITNYVLGGWVCYQ